MTKSPITLQELRRRIYVKAKAEKSWRFLRQGFGWKRWSRRWMYGTVGLFTDYRVRYLVDPPKDGPGSIGHITLRGKCAGARSAGKPHAACDVAGCPSYKFRPVQKSWSFRVMPDSVGGMHTILLHNASRIRNFDSVRIFGHDGLRLRMCRALFRELWQTRGLP